jgi:hypothetical protein
MEIYTPLEEAKEEIWRRWNVQTLKEKVTKFLGDIPGVFQSGPRACYDRNIISPNNELIEFLSLSCTTHLKPLGFEYFADKFVSKNIDKYYLSIMPFHKGVNRKNQRMYQYRRIIDFNKFDGKSFKNITTLWGENLVDFHHRLISMKSLAIDQYDASSWYRLNGMKASNYYLKFLALFICHGILFENYDAGEEEEEFDKQVVFPAIEEITTIFHLKPLIIRLLPPKEAYDLWCYSYSGEIEKEVIRCLNGAFKLS